MFIRKFVLASLSLFSLVATSTSAFAQSPGEFERGYQAGLSACRNTSFRCTLHWTSAAYDQMPDAYGVGITKAAALQDLMQGCAAFGGETAEETNAAKCARLAKSPAVTCRAF